MARFLDTLPTPGHVKPKKLVVLSAPRTGTLGLWMALNQLGLRSYHMMEVLDDGADSARILCEGMNAELFHDGRPYGRAEFDKWFADYDVINEMPFWMMHSIVKAYPDAKFLLVERDPEKWARSFMNTILAADKKYSTFPYQILRYFDNFAFRFSEFLSKNVAYFTNGLGSTEQGQQRLVENYKDYIAEVKRIVPPEQLHTYSLETGFGWKEICETLEVAEPDTQWPTRNEPESFHELLSPFMHKGIMRGVTGVTSIILPALLAGVWYVKHGGLSLFS
ncbi:P-loop containing nucleoside triphosphate hydrolase protein [Xylariaceae sp. FL0804]|nr:P-loop containing nucleoside triphosphate hydrolase protein [Xylariaceae sp. FL0804]